MTSRDLGTREDASWPRCSSAHRWAYPASLTWSRRSHPEKNGKNSSRKRKPLVKPRMKVMRTPKARHSKLTRSHSCMATITLRTMLSRWISLGRRKSKKIRLIQITNQTSTIASSQPVEDRSSWLSSSRSSPRLALCLTRSSSRSF